MQGQILQKISLPRIRRLRKAFEDVEEVTIALEELELRVGGGFNCWRGLHTGT